MNRVDLILAARNAVAELVAMKNIDISEIENSQDLLATGVLDSLDYLSLVSNLEEITGASLDLDTMEEATMATVDGLVASLEIALKS